MIKTKRLRLVRLGPEHAPEILAFYTQNKEFLEAYEPLKLKGFFKLSYHVSAIKAELVKESQGKSIKFLMYPLDSTKLIGMITINEIIKGCFQSCFVGYKMDKKHVNLGYMTECLAAIVDFTFNTLHLHRIEANIMPKNTPSLRVAEKVGFVNEGVSKHYLRINGKWEDHIHMVKLNPND